MAVGPGGVYVGGRTTGTLATQTKVGGVWDSFVIKFNLSGVSQWVRQFGGTGDADDVYGLAVGTEILLVTGSADGPLPGQTFVGGQDAFIRLYDSNGTELGTRQFGNGLNDFGTGVTADSSGFYVSGTKLGSALDLTPIGDNDIFVLKVIPASLHACGVVFPLATATSTCRNTVTICSGLYLCIGIFKYLLHEILSHFGWYRNRRAG
ncbi:MAG: hypothetical protein EXQ56_13530, partial [Acidobacteria bacterium]|nr:hypothetical protein [Acidobacteriota bacterium]